MSKSKRRRSGDRLSELPDSSIFHIFWFLPISDVVRTTKLSKRWRNLWKICPFLNFSDDEYDGSVEYNLDKVRSIFNRALLLWEGAKLLKFKIMIGCKLSISLVGDINVWVRFAKGKGVKELYLDLWYPSEIADNYYTDSELGSLYSCSSLEVLSMKGCPVCIGNGNVKCDRLKSLTISSMSLRPDMLSRVLGGSPNLEVFILNCFDPKFGEKWCIQSSSLKILSIAKVSYASYYERGFEMKIQTPNLEALVISGSPFSSFFMDVAPLTDVTLGLDCLSSRCDWYITEEFLDIKGTLERILPSIQHVESLTLCHSCLEVLGVMNMKSLLSPLSKLKFLKLKTSELHSRTFSKHLQIAGLLQNFPKLKRLVIDDDYQNMLYKDENEDDDDYPDDQESQEFEENFPNSFLLELRTVEVSWAMCDGSIFSFIETLLKYASKLEKMVFRVHGGGFIKAPSSSVFLASHKLLRMPRSSPTAQLIFCKD